MFKRLIKTSKSHSFFLFGPRSTGKSTWLKQLFIEENCLWLDLLDTSIERRFAQNPETLLSIIDADRKIEWVVIDEIQKVPSLLDIVHKIIFEKKIKFALTGSSARKIKRGGANLLAGRAFKYTTHPLTFLEIGSEFNLEDVLRWGALPAIFGMSVEDKADYLRAYVENYFKEEIVVEQLVRKTLPFRNFLDVASQSNGKILNINAISRDIGVDHATVQTYFEILEDTLVGFLLPPYHTSLRKRQRTGAKFYYFDLGVQRALAKKLEIILIDSSYDYGDAFEHFVILEIKRLIDYRKPDWRLSYYQTKDGVEIDLIIERPGEKKCLIEIKSTKIIQNLNDKKLSNFLQLVKSFEDSESYVFSNDKLEQIIEGTKFLHWQKGISKLFSLTGL